LDSIALRFINQAEIRELLSWIDRIPEENRQPQVRLNLAHAWAAMFAHNYSNVEPLLKLAEGHLKQPGKLPPDLPPAQLSASINTVRAYVATRSGRLEESIDLSEQALLILGAEPDLPTPDLRGPINLNLGITYQRLDQIEAAEDNFQEALKRNREAERGFATLATYGNLVRLNIARGELAAAKRIGKDGLAWSADFTDKVSYPIPAEAEIRLELARLYYQLNSLGEAREHQSKGLELVLWGSPTVAAKIYDLAFYWHLAKGDISGAKVCQDECKRLIHNEFFENHNKEAAREVDRLLTLWRQQGGRPELLTAAKGWAKTRTFELKNRIPYRQEFEYSVYARLLLADDQAHRALTIAKRLARSADNAGRYGDQVGHLLITVEALKALDRIGDALDALQDALVLAEPGGAIRIFIDGGSEIIDLLKIIKAAGWRERVDKKRVDAYLNTLLDAIVKERNHLPVETNQSLTEGLSRRELDVLRLLSTHLTGPEISKELFISVNTYKSHTKNIYSKLQVGSRAEVISRARELGLIES
jgi:LuxR family maltose regulon positive regulatory protein